MAWGLTDTTPTLAPAATATVSSTTDTSSSDSPARPLAPILDSIEAVDVFEGVDPITSVALEGVALLQIIKHCHESLPRSVSGLVLGLDNNQVLEVTNSFASLPLSERKKGTNEYEMDMMKCLCEVGMDNNKVGWYQSVAMGTFCTASFIEQQYQYQKSLGPNAICLIYDSVETSKGSLSLRAVRLTKAFVDTYKSGAFTKESFAKTDIRSATVVEEVPIEIRNSGIVTCWLEQTKESVSASSFERLDLATNAYLENSLKNMTLWADELAQEHYKFQGFERALSKQRAAYQQWQNRQRDENKARRETGEKLVPEEDPNFFKSVSQPSRLESLLITKQMNTYCEHINRYAGKSFQKLFLAAKIHQNE